MKSSNEMMLQELVAGIASTDEKYINGVPFGYYVSELTNRLPEIEAAVAHAEESGLHSVTCCCVCCDLLRAYRAAKNARINKC